MRAVLFEAENGSDGKEPSAFRVGASVGADGTNRPADVTATKRALALLDIIPEDEANAKMAPRTFNGAIELFQSEFNLKRDGKLRPGGETERTLARVARSDLREGRTEFGVFDFPGSLDMKRGLENAGTRPPVETSPADGNPVIIGPEKKQSEIDEIEQKFWKIAQLGRKEGHTLAAEMLERFLFAEGGKKTLPAERIRAFPAVREAERENRNRFDLDWLKTTSIAYEKITGLKDGEEIVIKVKDPKNKQPREPYFVKSVEPSMFSTDNRDLFAASGDSKITSTGSFRAKRVGNTVEVAGTVTHHWEDKYDWEGGRLGWTYIPGFGLVPDEEGKKLTVHGRGKPFDMEARWQQEVKGAVKLRPGLTAESSPTPFDTKFEWSPVKQ